MQVIFLAIVLLAIAIGGIAIKMFFIPGGTFRKTCGSQFDPKTGKALACSCHSNEPDDCSNPDVKN